MIALVGLGYGLVLLVKRLGVKVCEGMLYVFVFWCSVPLGLDGM